MSNDDPNAADKGKLNLESLRQIIVALGELAESLRRLEHFQNYAGRTNQAFRRSSIQQHWNAARETARTIAEILQNGQQMTVPVLTYDIDADGRKIARVNTTLVRDVLAGIWPEIDQIACGESLSSSAELMYGLSSFCERLDRSGARLRAILNSASIAPS